jgi:ABC-type branched-subunit amino acid transport system substrate-binding protein
MRTHHLRVEPIVVLAACVCMGWLLGGSAASAQSGDELSLQEQRGKQIYLKGEGSGGEIKARLSGGLELAASAFPCANCHGMKGEGSREGGLQPPPLTWDMLTTAGQSALTRQQRGPYDDATLARAITSGLSPAGVELHPGMPRFQMSGGQMADLIAYLKKLGKAHDSDPGLTEDTIKVGAALPLTGPLAGIGEDIKEALGATFAEVNRQGGVYGRRFEMIVADSHGDAAGTREATRNLVEQDNVFALVGSFEPTASAATHDLLKQQEVPLIGPVTLSPRQAGLPNPYVFYLLPSFADQSRALVDFIHARQGRPAQTRLAVVYADNDLDQDALSGLRSQAKLHSMEIVIEQKYAAEKLSAQETVKALVEKKPDSIFFFGSGDEFTAFAVEMDRANLDAGLFSSAVMIGRSAFNLPPAVAARTFLAYPASLPERDDFGGFISLMQKSGVRLRSASFQAVAYAAAKVFVEAVKSSHRQFNRADVIKALEQLRDYATDVVAPVTFGPNRRIGASGSYVVKIALEKKQYVPTGDRIVPSDYGNR